jgi:hypothetical protein
MVMLYVRGLLALYIAMCYARASRSLHCIVKSVKLLCQVMLIFFHTSNFKKYVFVYRSDHSHWSSYNSVSMSELLPLHKPSNQKGKEHPCGSK